MLGLRWRDELEPVFLETSVTDNGDRELMEEAWSLGTTKVRELPSAVASGSRGGAAGSAAAVVGAVASGPWVTGVRAGAGVGCRCARKKRRSGIFYIHYWPHAAVAAWSS